MVLVVCRVVRATRKPKMNARKEDVEQWAKEREVLRTDTQQTVTAIKVRKNARSLQTTKNTRSEETIGPGTILTSAQDGGKERA